MKKSLLLLLLLAGFFALAPKPTRAQAVTGVSLNKHTLSLDRWHSDQLAATVSPSDAANKAVSWTSSNDDVASVDETGYVNARRDGIATIYVKTKDGGFTDSCVVTCQVANAANFVTFSFEGESIDAGVSTRSYSVSGYLPHGTNPANLTVKSYEISPGASISPLPETIHDFSDTVSFVITAPDGKTQKTWKVRTMIIPDLTGTQKIDLTFSTAPQGWIGDTVSWEEQGIYFHVDFPSPADTTWLPSAEVDEDQDYSHKIGIGLFPGRFNFYLKDTSKVIVAASMYILENCGDSCSYVFFNGEGYTKTFIEPGTRSFHFFDLSAVKASEGEFRSLEGSFTGITFYFANKDGSVNHLPVAHAGPDQTVYAKDTVQLDGSASYDPDQDLLHYQWTAPQGITLDNSLAVNPTFIAPNSTDTLRLTFMLSVTDGKSTPVNDQVTVTVIPTNHRPTADAGPDQTVFENDSVYLDGTASSDPDGDSLRFIWLAPGGIHLTDSTSRTPAFKAPPVQQTTVFSFALTVNDGLVNSVLDTVFITVKNKNQRPIAWIDIDQITVNEGDTAFVDGHYSYDPDGDSLRFHWQAQTGSGIGIFDSTDMDIRCGVPMVDHDTTFMIFIKVDDGQLYSEPDTAYIHVINTNNNSVPEAAIYLHTAPVNDGDTVYVDGSASFDPDGDSLTYIWTAPNSIYLHKEGDSAWFIAPIVQKETPFVITLVVNDGQVNSPPAYDTVWVRHVNHAPVAESGYPIQLFEGDSSYLYGSLSYDFDGDQLTYSWKVPAGFWIADSTQADPRFSAPQVRHDTTFSLILTVFDGQLYSAPDTCRVIVKNKNHAPVAQIVSTAQVFYGVRVNEGDTLWIDGSPSYDPDGDSLTYDWFIPKDISYYHYDSVKTMIIAPEVQRTTSFDAGLKVSDGQLKSPKDLFIIQVVNVNKIPVAEAGKSFTILSGQTAQMNGSNSWDPDGDSLRYTWMAPAGIALSDVHAVNPSFTAPEVTSIQKFTFKLVVSDGLLVSDTSRVEVTVKPVMATLSITATLNNDTVSYRQRHITLYRENDQRSWIPENVLSYNDNGETYYAVWAGDWMISVDPVGDSTGFVSTFSGDVTWWTNENAITIAGGTETHVNIHCVAAGGGLTGDGIINGHIRRDTNTTATARPAITIAHENNDGDAPVAGVTIFLYRSSDKVLLTSTLTDEQGKYVFTHLPKGGYYLIVQLPGYDPNTPWEVTVADDNSQVSDVNFVVSDGNQSVTDVAKVQDIQVKLYPNPVIDRLYVQINQPDAGAVARLYDITGHLVMTEKLNSRTTKLYLSGLRKGIYLLRINNQGSVITRKLIKQ